MDLFTLREQIDDIDDKILDLFVERMKVCEDIAEYKKNTKLSVLQSNREIEVIDMMRKKSPDTLKDGTAVLFTNIMDISKSLQQRMLKDRFTISTKPFNPKDNLKIGCQGVSGSNQEEATKKLFEDKKINFYTTFSDVFEAVKNQEIDIGILPIQNSTAGSVSETYDLMRKYNFYISATIVTPINHCLAVKKGTTFNEIEKVISHPQALNQCSEFLRINNFNTENYFNTASAAKLTASSDSKIAAICSPACAELYGLTILKNDIADISPNYTRFICITRDFYISQNPDTISVALSLPNVKGSLYRLLTKFYVYGLDLKHIESKPLKDGSFDVIFYLDFTGNINEANTACLLNELKSQLSYFKFLGNYEEF